MEMEPKNVFLNLTAAVPFDAAWKWAKLHSDYAVNWVPRYTKEKKEKQFQKWLKQNGKN